MIPWQNQLINDRFRFRRFLRHPILLLWLFLLWLINLIIFEILI